MITCPGGEIGRRKGLNYIEHSAGNCLREWGQIRGNLSVRLMAIPSEALLCGERVET